jgi:hypothetical protein
MVFKVIPVSPRVFRCARTNPSAEPEAGGESVSLEDVIGYPVMFFPAAEPDVSVSGSARRQVYSIASAPGANQALPARFRSGVRKNQDCFNTSATVSGFAVPTVSAPGAGSQSFG